jgi:hypothetical protein
MLPIRHSAAGFPMAPTQEEWDALTPRQQAEVVAALPGEVTDAEMAPPEGDRHFRAKTGVLGALRGYFARQGRRVYLAAELPTYYPAEPRFAPDLLAVLGLDVQVERDRLRFHAGTALLLESEELIARLETLLDDAQKRAEEETQRAEEEARRAASAEAELARVREELARLKK